MEYLQFENLKRQRFVCFQIAFAKKRQSQVEAPTRKYEIAF